MDVMLPWLPILLSYYVVHPPCCSSCYLIVPIAIYTCVVEKTSPCYRISAKEDISQYVDTLTEVAKSLVESKNEVMPVAILDKHMKTATKIRNQTEGVGWLVPFG